MEVDVSASACSLWILAMSNVYMSASRGVPALDSPSYGPTYIMIPFCILSCTSGSVPHHYYIMSSACAFRIIMLWRVGRSVLGSTVEHELCPLLRESSCGPLPLASWALFECRTFQTLGSLPTENWLSSRVRCYCWQEPRNVQNLTF